jgi:alpha-galactosidase
MRALILTLLVSLAVIICAAGQDQPAPPPSAPASLTPPSPPAPEIHGARVFGVRPGHPVVFTIAATGDRPMTFSAEGLPAGLSVNATTGQITGNAPAAAGDFTVTLHAKSAQGQTSRTLRIKVGDTIALTPPLGWNSWNCFAQNVTEAKVKAAADAMVSSGLVNHGWTYVNVDDFWQTNNITHDSSQHGPERNADGSIHPNSNFPDMQGLADYIHARGLRAGLYSSPGPYTCGACTGSYQHEAQDVATYAAWGYDYLKYDWCTYSRIYKDSEGVEGMQKPYRMMAGFLRTASRDIVFSFCQYGMGDSWKLAAANGGNLWRSTGDINNSWDSMRSNSQRGVDIGQYAGPGHWNDPDMLEVGTVQGGQPTKLTPDEQYAHISLWCLQAAPLLIGCDLTKLDPFTLGLLTNDEVIDIDQDPLGKAAHVVAASFDEHSDPVVQKAQTQVWERPLEDGSIAVGLFNFGSQPAAMTVGWSQVNLTGSCKVRDLWRQKDLGSFSDSFGGTVPSHGVLLVRISKS